MRTAFLLYASSLLVVGCAREGPTMAASKPDANLVEMSQNAQRNAGVVVTSAALVELTGYLHVAGTVQPIDSRVGSVRALARGRVQDVLARVGDRVDAGQPLARIDLIEAGELRSEYAAARAELQKLTVQQANATRHLDRLRSLAGIGVTSQRDLELADGEHAAIVQTVRAQESQLIGLEAKLRRLGLSEADGASSITAIRAPFAGVVIRAQAAPGDVVDSEVGLFAVADLSDVWVQAEVFEKDLGRVQIGQPARITVDTYAGQTFSGHVAYVSDVLDPKTRTAQVRCVVPNRDRRLKIDMLVGVDVPTTTGRTVLAVPVTAVQDLSGRTVVFVRTSDHTFHTRDVKVGESTGGRIEIVSGLREGESVVVEGAHHLKSIRLSGELGEG